MVHLAYIVLRSELMTLWAVGPALTGSYSSSGEGNCSVLRSREPTAELAEKQTERWEGSSSRHKQVLYESSRDQLDGHKEIFVKGFMQLKSIHSLHLF